MGNNREIVNVCLITESRHGEDGRIGGMDVPSSRYSMRVQIFVRTLHFFPFFFSPFFFFYACNIGGHRGSANANFHPFIPVTHNPLKRRERGEGGGYELIGSRRKHR